MHPKLLLATSFRWAALGAALVLGCAPRPEPLAAGAPPLAGQDPAPPADEPADARSASERELASQRAADDAVERVAERLREAERTCGAGADEPSACAPQAFAADVDAYQAHYAQRVDPRAASGRIDALPRLGGPGEATAEVLSRVLAACTGRCDAAHKATVRADVAAAVARCLKAGAAACSPLDSLAEPGLVAQCRAQCAEARKEAAAEAAFERARPKTAAQAASCTRLCKAKCPQGAMCGTCELSCAANCAPAGQ